MDILILTGKFGMGHWSASRSLQEQLAREGHQVSVVDLFDYAMPELAPAMYRGFNFLVTYVGGIYNAFHRMTRDAEGEVPLAGQFIRRLGRLLAAARPEVAIPLYAKFVALCREKGFHTETGEFGADMLVQSVNDGPLTLIVDTDQLSS